MTDTLDAVLGGLMRRYEDRVPNVRKIMDCMIRAGLIRSIADIENDHIAFRTMGVPHLGVASLEKIFLHLGYNRRDSYTFPGKKLDAFWYSPPQHRYPRIFISQLNVDELTEEAGRIIHSYTDTVSFDPVDRLDLDDAVAVDAFLHQPLWRTPTWADYERLAAESEYASWVIYNRYYLNHFTISVHHLPAPLDNVARFNKFLESHAILLNDAGGKVKVSEDGQLIQSSTVAAMIDAEFDDGGGGIAVHKIPGSYVEFAERRVLPDFAHLPPGDIRPEHRREGFETGNADKIFESTFRSQTQKML